MNAHALLVSILIRSMDRETLSRALDSAARQTWPNLEIVVVAACGSGHRDLPTEHAGRPLRLVGTGGKLTRPQAANAALEAARGEWLNFLDDDDELLPEHIATLMSAPRPNSERVVFSRTRVIDANGKPLGHISHAGNRVQLPVKYKNCRKNAFSVGKNTFLPVNPIYCKLTKERTSKAFCVLTNFVV